MTVIAKPLPADASDVTDVCMRLLNREALRLEKRRTLTGKEIDLVVRIARASAEVTAIQLDPLGPKGRRQLTKMTDAELAEARQRLEAAERGTTS